MNGRTVLPVFTLEKGRRRRAFVLGEALILMIVVLVTLGGLFSSIGYAMRLRSHAQEDLDGHMVAQAWLDALESEQPETIDSQSSLIVKAGLATKRLGGESLSSGRFAVRSVVLTPVFTGTESGARRIGLKVEEFNESGKPCATPLNFSRSFNIHNSGTVQDNASKRQPQG